MDLMDSVVNDMKVEPAKVLLETQNGGDSSNKTYIFGNEDHTLGNVLRHVLMQAKETDFCGYSLINLVAEFQLPWAVGFDGFHEIIRDQNRQVEHTQTRAVRFGGDEVFDIGVVATHGGHHGPTARASRHDGAAHRIPNVHE